MGGQVKQSIVSSLCKHLSLDPTSFSADIDKCDVKTLCINILKASPNGSTLLCNDEVTKWITVVDKFPEDSEGCLKITKDLNDELAQKAVILGDGLKLSEADVIVYAVLHPYVVGIAESEREKLPNLLRWMDYVQNMEAVQEAFEKIQINKVPFDFPVPKVPVKETKADSKETGQKSDKKKEKGEKQTTDKAAGEKDSELSVSLLNIQVGLIRKAWKHPSADSLLVEEIDIGEANVRQVVSGLAKFCSPEDLTSRLVALITNVKPGKLRDVKSEGLVLCASNEDHTKVEPLIVPEGAKPGERVSISGHEGKPEDVLNPKKKQLEKITPNLYTDDKGVATFKGIPFMTSAGACSSSIPKASIK